MRKNNFAEFNTLLNPTNDAIYLVLSRSASAKGTPINISTALTILGTDLLAEIGIFLPPEIAAVEIADDAIIKYILDKQYNVIVTKVENKYIVYAKDPSVKTTTNNTLVCGVEASTYSYSKSGKALLIPFAPANNKSIRLKDAECLQIPDVLDALPPILKPLYKISRNAPDSTLQYPLSVDVGNSLIAIYRNMIKLGYAQKTRFDISNEINENLCAHQLTEDELKVLFTENLLSQEISEFYGPKGEFLHNKMGEFLIREMSIKKDKKSKRLYFYDDNVGIYRSENDTIIGTMVKLCPSIKEYQRNEVMSYLDASLSCAMTEFNANAMNVVFRNGVLDVETMTLKPMSPENLETIQINCDYNPSSVAPVVDEFFDTFTCHNKEIEQLLFEAMGYAMLKTSELQKSFLLIGSGRNGKSTYFDLIKDVLGRENVTAISFKDLATTFRASSLDGKLASLAGDISSQPITESDLFKSISAGEDVLIEKKYEQAFECKLFSTMFFSANKLPRTMDNSAGFYRRFCIIPCTADLTAVSSVQGRAFALRLRSKQAKEYAAYKAVCAIHEVLTSTFEFTTPKVVSDIINKYKISNSSALSWFAKKHRGDREALKKQTASNLYQDYKEWCGTYKYGTCKLENFTDDLCNHCNLAINQYDMFVEKTDVDKSPIDLLVEVPSDEEDPFAEQMQLSFDDNGDLPY